MSIFKRNFFQKKSINSKLIFRSTLIAGTVLFSANCHEAFAKGKSYVAVEPLVCDLVKSMALPSDEVKCLVDRKQDVHDLKITPRQAQLLNNADKVFTLGKEMTPTMKNWEEKSKTVLVGVSAIDVENPSAEEGGAYEWAGLFDLAAGNYTWSFAKVDGEYADPAMKMVILESNDIEESEDFASELLEADDSISKKDNGTLSPNNKAYTLNFDQKKDKTVFNIEIKKDGNYSFFTEHMPFEFEADEHFLKDIARVDVEPIAQVPDEGDGHHHHHHHGHGSLDPHVWHDPSNVIKMSKLISKSLKKDISVFNRKDRNLVNERISSANAILEDLQSWTSKQVSTIPISNKVIVSKHKAMDYYGAAYGFETISLLDFLGESSSLRPANISSVLKELKEDNVQVLFPEQKPASKLLKNLSRQSSIPLAKEQIFVDGLMPQGNTISVAVHNTCTIVNSLGGSCDKKAGINLENQWDSLFN